MRNKGKFASVLVLNAMLILATIGIANTKNGMEIINCSKYGNILPMLCKGKDNLEKFPVVIKEPVKNPGTCHWCGIPDNKD